MGTGLGHHEVLLGDAKVLDVSLKLALDQALELRVNRGVLEAILFCAFEDHAFLLNKVDNWVFPQGRLEELGHDLQDPFL